MYTIRPYEKEQDYQMLREWTEVWVNATPPEGIYCEEGTFILEIDETPALCLTVLGTQCEQMCYMFNYIKNPLLKHTSLEEYGSILWQHCFEYAKNFGYKRILCFSEHDKLTEQYKRFGMQVTLKVTGLCKEL